MDPLGMSLAVGAVVAAILGYFLGRNRERARQLEEKEAARDEASLIRKRAEQDADNVRLAAELQAKEDVYRLRETWESEESRRREDVERGERRLLNRAETVDRKSDLLDRRADALVEREAGLKRKESEVAGRGAEVERALAETRTRLEALAGVTADEARSELVAEIKDEARAEAANRVREIRDEAQRTADREAKRLVAMAIQRMAADETAQLTVSVVQLPSDEMKGRIIGREGRNIRAFEQATGIDVIIDDTPEAVVLSGYNPVRREVARVALARLIEDGRIHPARIEETVAMRSSRSSSTRWSPWPDSWRPERSSSRRRSGVRQ